MLISQRMQADVSRDPSDKRTALKKVKASRDPSCLSSVKFIYKFEECIKDSINEVFVDCDMTIVRFSRMMVGSKDLMKIIKKNEFQADFVVGGSSATVYFKVVDDIALMRSLEAFDCRLREVGYDHVTYVSAESPHCSRCPVKHAKHCSL